MSEVKATVAAPEGLHARPAALFAQAAKGCGLPVKISKGDKGPVDAGSTLSLMTLGAAKGDEVTLSAEGEGADEVLAKLKEMLETAE